MSVDVTPASLRYREQAGPAAVGAAVLAVVSVAAAVGRPILVAGGSDSVLLGRIGVLAGVLAVASGLGLIVHAASRAQVPWRRTGAFVALGGAGALASFVYASHRAGELRLDRFARTFFDLDVLRAITGDLGRGLVNTVKLSFISEVLAIGVGLVVATMVMSPRRWLRWPGRAYVDVVRSTPLVVLTLLLNTGLPSLGITLGFFSAVVVTLTINASAYVAEIFRAGIQGLPRGQMHAAQSLGMPRATAMLYVVIPQGARAVIPPLLNEFIALIKDSAIVAAVTGFTIQQREIFGAAKSAVAATFNTTPYLAAALLYVAMIIPMTRLVDRLERRLRAGLA